MTTENSVRVPDGWRVMAFTGSFAARGERWEIYDPDGNGGGVCAGDVTDESVANLLDALTGLAAPAPAGSLPEQGAGLAWPKPMDGRIEWLKRWSDQGQHRRIPGPSAGEAYELAIELEQLRNQWNALARQQSRVVDEGMIERARQCIVMLRHHLGLFVQDDIALAMFKTAEEIETELRAAAATMSMMI